MRKIPGLNKFSLLVLKRGFTQDRTMWDWYATVLSGNVQRKSLSVILLDEQRNSALRWNFHDCWIAKYEGPHLDAKSNDVAIEAIEIAQRGLNWSFEEDKTEALSIGAARQSAELCRRHAILRRRGSRSPGKGTVAATSR